jgi:hypothetical protein
MQRVAAIFENGEMENYYTIFIQQGNGNSKKQKLLLKRVCLQKNRVKIVAKKFVL